MANNMTRREAEARKNAVLKWFLQHPDATGLEAQDALKNGRITGKSGPSMNTKMVHDLQRKASSMLHSGFRAPSPAVGKANPAGTEPQMDQLRGLIRQIQVLLTELPDVEEVAVSRSEARLARRTVQHEVLPP